MLICEGKLLEGCLGGMFWNGSLGCGIGAWVCNLMVWLGPWGSADGERGGEGRGGVYLDVAS